MGSLEDTIGQVEKDCQAVRKEGIIHHREGLYHYFDVRERSAIARQSVRRLEQLGFKVTLETAGEAA